LQVHNKKAGAVAQMRDMMKWMMSNGPQAAGEQIQRNLVGEKEHTADSKYIGVGGASLGQQPGSRGQDTPTTTDTPILSAETGKKRKRVSESPEPKASSINHVPGVVSPALSPKSKRHDSHQVARSR
jgi:hypothetical protein